MCQIRVNQKRFIGSSDTFLMIVTRILGMQTKATRQVESGQQHPYPAKVVNRQPAVIQCAYDLDVLNL